MRSGVRSGVAYLGNMSLVGTRHTGAPVYVHRLPLDHLLPGFIVSPLLLSIFPSYFLATTTSLAATRGTSTPLNIRLLHFANQFSSNDCLIRPAQRWRAHIQHRFYRIGLSSHRFPSSLGRDQSATLSTITPLSTPFVYASPPALLRPLLLLLPCSGRQLFFTKVLPNHPMPDESVALQIWIRSRVQLNGLCRLRRGYIGLHQRICPAVGTPNL